MSASKPNFPHRPSKHIKSHNGGKRKKKIVMEQQEILSQLRKKRQRTKSTEFRSTPSEIQEKGHGSSQIQYNGGDSMGNIENNSLAKFPSSPSNIGSSNSTTGRHRPLADRLRPKSLSQIVGHSNVLKQLCSKKSLTSAIFWGNAGIGKTTLCRILPHHFKLHFISLSAVTSGKKKLQESISEARNRLNGLLKQQTVLFVDEIHRWNKAQQDQLLPFVEDGTIILLGCTTENPSFSCNNALLSRMDVFHLDPPNESDMLQMLHHALSLKEYKFSTTNDSEKNLTYFQGHVHLGKFEKIFIVSKDSLIATIQYSQGDCRKCLNTVESALYSLATIRSSDKSPRDDDISLHLSETIKFQLNAPRYSTDNHYDCISAFIKSIRGSDVDASMYYLFRMLGCGDAPEFIARRLVILASEDIGLRDNSCLMMATAALTAVKQIGMPEATYPLAHCTLMLAKAKKSNAVLTSIRAAKELVSKFPNTPIPLHLRNAPTKLLAEMGCGQDYKYPHNYPGNIVDDDDYSYWSNQIPNVERNIVPESLWNCETESYIEAPPIEQMLCPIQEKHAS